MSGIEESVFYKIDLYSKLSNELNLIFEKYYVSPPYFVNAGMVGTEGGHRRFA